MKLQMELMPDETEQIVQAMKDGSAAVLSIMADDKLYAHQLRIVAISVETHHGFAWSPDKQNVTVEFMQVIPL